MSHSSDTVRCDGCGAEIFLAPVMHDERIYCCEDCANDRPCHCAERQEDEDERRTSAESGSPAVETG
jgi:hypothetical protein